MAITTAIQIECSVSSVGCLASLQCLHCNQNVVDFEFCESGSLNFFQKTKIF